MEKGGTSPSSAGLARPRLLTGHRSTSPVRTAQAGSVSGPEEVPGFAELFSEETDGGVSISMGPAALCRCSAWLHFALSSTNRPTHLPLLQRSAFLCAQG